MFSGSGVAGSRTTDSGNRGSSCVLMSLLSARHSDILLPVRE
jgi:hypothetical protein